MMPLPSRSTSAYGFQFGSVGLDPKAIPTLEASMMSTLPSPSISPGGDIRNSPPDQLLSPLFPAVSLMEGLRVAVTLYLPHWEKLRFVVVVQLYLNVVMLPAVYDAVFCSITTEFRVEFKDNVSRPVSPISP